MKSKIKSVKFILLLGLVTLLYQHCGSFEGRLSNATPSSLERTPNEVSPPRGQISPPITGNLRAFPGAEGFGADSIGGRGGRIVKVTNLSDSGEGSFRNAVETMSEPRIVVFEVSGIINLESSIRIRNSYLTIAGQTSPSGIMITGYQTTIQASHVIIQHIRFRVGSHRISDGANPEQLDSLDIWGYDDPNKMVHDVIVDHCSVGWGVDENFSTAYNLTNVTISNTIIAEGLRRAGHPKGQHSMGMLIWTKYSPNLKISIHHNYFAHNYARNPLINTAPTNNDIIVDLANNVVYDFYGGNTMGASGGNLRINWRHNFSMPGLSSNTNVYEVFQSGSSSLPAPLIYVQGNIGKTRTSQTEFFRIVDDLSKSLRGLLCSKNIVCRQVI